MPMVYNNNGDSICKADRSGGNIILLFQLPSISFSMTLMYNCFIIYYYQIDNTNNCFCRGRTSPIFSPHRSSYVTLGAGLPITQLSNTMYDT